MNARAAAVETLERRLGYAFKDHELLERALTHASVGGSAARVRDNEVLEFVGDRVIGLLAAERLMEIYPQAPEGDLSRRLNALVSGKACAEVARRMGVGPALRLAPGETGAGGRDKDSILACACEAIMAAIYCDGGLAPSRSVFLDLWSETFASLGEAPPRDPKTRLQEWAQGQGKPLPAYAVTGREGPDHRPLFTVEVAVQGLAPVAAEGRSRQAAEMAAADALLAREGQA